MKNTYKLGIEKVLNSRHHPLPNLDEVEANRLGISFGNRLPSGRGSVRFVKSWCFLESGSVYANFCKQVLAAHEAGRGRPARDRSPALQAMKSVSSRDKAAGLVQPVEARTM
jgi:hypothetical protein